MSVETKRSEDRKKKLVAFTTASFPDLATSIKIVNAIADAGVDLIEIGIPFSDPVADGLVIQASSARALKTFTFSELWELLGAVRTNDSSVELSIMTCINPLLSYGLEQFLAKCQEFKVASTILSDVPLLAFKRDFLELYEKYVIANNFLVTTATSPKRLAEYNELGGGFLYLVTAPAITGIKAEIDKGALEKVANQVTKPCYLGFGIDSIAKAKELEPLADGIIIGSEIIRIIAECLIGERVPDAELMTYFQRMTVPAWVDFSRLTNFLREVKGVLG